MSLAKETGCSEESSPVPKFIHARGQAESESTLVQLQASRLLRLYAVSGPMAEVLALLAFLEMLLR
jgi:hypothetical protein